MAEATDAAFAIASDMAAELVQKIPLAEEEAGDDRLRADLNRARRVEAPPNVMAGGEQQEAAVAQNVEQETAQENELDLPSYEVDLPDELRLELDEPDFNAEAEAELAEGEDLDDLTYDETDSEERKRRIAAEKRNQWLEGRLAEQNAAKWKAERDKYFPLAEIGYKALAALNVELPKPASRRAYLKQARSVHQAMLPNFKPLVETLSSATEKAKQEAIVEGKSEVRAAWGEPTTGPGTAPVAASKSEADLEAARKTGNLAKVIGVLRKQATESR